MLCQSSKLQRLLALKRMWECVCVCECVWSPSGSVFTETAQSFMSCTHITLMTLEALKVKHTAAYAKDTKDTKYDWLKHTQPYASLSAAWVPLYPLYPYALYPLYPAAKSSDRAAWDSSSYGYEVKHTDTKDTKGLKQHLRHTPRKDTHHTPTSQRHTLVADTHSVADTQLKRCVCVGP